MLKKMHETSMLTIYTIKIIWHCYLKIFYLIFIILLYVLFPCIKNSIILIIISISIINLIKSRLLRKLPIFWS